MDLGTPWVLKQLASSTRRGSKIKLNIPPTVLLSNFDFHHGHHHFLHTGKDGRLRASYPSQDGHPRHEPDHHRIRGALEFIRQLHDGGSFFVVWYADNEHEVMGIDFVLKLASRASWRHQVLAVQAHVVPAQLETGIFHSNEDELFGACGNMRDGAAKVGLNMLTKALARSVMDDGTQECRLDFMRAVYIVDGEGTLWFSHATNVRVGPSRKPVEDVGANLVLPAFQLVKSELKRILVRAMSAGASVEEVFAHFDLFKRGFVGSADLKRGLLNLGIGVSNKVADKLVQEMGGTFRFTVHDLASFTQGVGDGEVDVRSSGKRTKAVEGNNARGGSFLSWGELSDSEQKDKVRGSPCDGEAEAGVLEVDIATPRHNDREQGVTCSGGLDCADDDLSPSVLDTRLRQQHFPTELLWDDLPCWAREASKKALGELMGHHRRSLKRAQKDNSRQSTVLTQQLKLHIKPHRIVHGDVSTAAHGGPVSQRSGKRPVSGVDTDRTLPRGRKELERADLKLHVGGGNVLSYRWITRAVVRPDHGGSVLEAMEALSGSQEAMGIPSAQHEAFLLVAMPGLFMTLDAMERTLGGLLEHNPRGKLLLVGSLGLPGTQWADGEVLDAKTHAYGLSTLLGELMARGELCLSPSICVVLLGLGSGANAILNFATTFLVLDKFAALRDATRFLALVNPFPSGVPDTSLDVKRIKRRLKALKQTLERGAHHEQLECLVGAMFSAEHLEKNDRAVVLEQFWRTRQALELPEQTRPKSAPVPCSARTLQAEQTSGIEQSRRKVGVLDCMEGVLRGATLGALDGPVSVPVLLITSTRDALDTSGTAEHCRASLKAEDVDSLFELVSGNKHRRIKVYPVQAGREILQEAPVRTLEIILGAIYAAQKQPIVACPAEKTYPEGSACEDDVLDFVADPPAISSPSSLLERGGDLGEYAQVESPMGGAKEMGGGECMDGSPPTCTERLCDKPSPKGRRAREFDARKERAAERKAKSERLKRQQELNRMKRAKMEEGEILKQRQECLSMQEEDERSSAVGQHIWGLQVWASSVADAKERALELTSTRDASDEKLIEDQLARERAQQHVQRNELFRQRKLDLLEQDGGGDEVIVRPDGPHDEVEFAREACRNLLDQIHLLRRRIVKTMKTELLRRGQLETFQSQYDKLEAKLRASQRLHSTYARGGTTAGILGDVPTQHLKDIGVSVARQQTLLGTYQSVLKERREIWEMVVSHIQKLKIAISTKQSELQTTLQEVHLNMAALREKARGVRAKNESLATLRARVETETKTMQNRVKLLTREQSLLNSHDGNFFDSDIWQQGVTQRMSKERFAQDIQAELTTLGGAIRTNTRRTMLINETLASDTLEGQAISMAMQKFGQIAHVSRERLDRMNAKTIAQELQDILDAEAEQELKSADPSESAMSHQHNKAALIRTKPSHQRSLEEKQWVALDILINKDLYEALSAVENEELQLNDEYKTELRAEDVDRILELPREIQLALPHLKSVSEVEAHNLLITYSLECGEAEIAKADEQSQDHMFSVSAGETNTSMGHRILTGVAPATGAAPTQQHRRSRARNTSRANLRGLPALESPSYMWTDADSLDSSKPTLAGIPSVPRDTPKPLNLVEAISDVALKDVCEKDGEMAIRIGGREVYRSTRRLLGIQESRVHSFAIEHHPPIFCVDLKVVVTFTGCIDSRGFNRGRVSAVLRRNSAYDGRLEGATGRRVGYAPHSRQKLNLGDEFYQTPGTIMIQHCPRRVPLACSTYEVEVTALGPTAYEVVVDAGQCELCASLVDKRLEEAKRLKVRLKELALEQSDTWESVRLRERQYHVCNTLIEEADSECRRCQEAIDELCEYLRPRDVGGLLGLLPESSSNGTSSEESGTQSSSSTTTSSSTRSMRSTSATNSSTISPSHLSETEQEETWNEIAAIETEHMHWGRLFTTRCQEKASVKEALHKLMKLRRDGRAEKICLEMELKQMSAEIPIVVEVLQGAGAAAEMSRALRSSTGTAGSRPRSSGDEGSTVFLETPAGRTRQAFERGGWGALTLEEQQWVTMDQKLCPDKYEWLQQQQKEQEGAHNAHDKGGRKCKKPRKNPAIDQYRFHREELVRILAEPADDLNRREVHVRKLLHKFHDDPQLVSTDGPASYHETHDLSLAERTRLKDVQHRTATEKEWISIDKVLNPPIWKRAKEGVPGTHNDQRPSEEGRGGIDSDQQAWECPFNRDDLLRIWAQREDTSLKTEDERRAFNLLTDYYGACPGLSQSTNRGWKGVQMGKGVKGPHVDIDLRLRCLQRELDRVAHCSNPTMTSSTLHAAPQRYPTSTLRLNLEAEIDRLLREQVQQRERKNVYLTEDFSSSEEEGDTYSQGKKRATRRTRRLNRRTGRGTMNIFDARKRMLLESKKTPLERDNAMRIASLGPGGCPACMSNPCRWVPVIHVEGTKSRLERIADELHFARISAENVIESTLPSSVKRDGNTTFRRVDFIEDLSSEQKHLRLMMKLHFIDEEFHEANRTPKQHIQSTALHGYRTFLWTKDARVALEREHSRLVARVVAVEVAHDILEWMLDGWHFGERPSQRATIGGIPSIQAGNEGDVRTPCEQEEDRVKMFILPPGVEGSNWDNTSEKVVKEGGVHDQEIGFMEKTMRFGLFCVAVMYFRARWLLRQQRERSSEFKLGWKVDTSVPVRAQRKPISQTTVSSTQPGYQRVKVRKEKEQAEVLADFAGFVAVEKRELEAAQLIQRVLRGHIGRKAAFRWHEKRAEFNATNSLMVAAAVSIQRLLRGSWGRNRAKTIRAGIARWLTHLIDDEAREFEAEILSTNKLEALKRGIEDLMEDDDSDGGS